MPVLQSMLYRCLILFLLLMPMQLSHAAFPIGVEVTFTGGGTNETFNSDWAGEFRMAIDDSNNVTGYFDADGLSNRTICGAGDFEGFRIGNYITASFTSEDADSGCGFDRGWVFTLNGNLTANETVFSGEYSISSGQQGDFSFTTEQSQAEWKGLDALKAHYEKNKGTPEAAYIHQVACLAEKSAEHYSIAQAGWSAGFAKHVFDSISGPDGLPESVKLKCRAGQTGAECLNDSLGEYHGWKELRPAFFSYCDKIANEHDMLSWVGDHELFLRNAVRPCFDQISQAGEISVQEAEKFKESVTSAAVALRGVAIGACAIEKGLPTIITNANKESMNDAQEVKNRLFSDILESGGKLQVRFADVDFIMDVGQKTQVLVHRINDDQSLTDITSNVGLTYLISDIGQESFRISSSGELEVIRKNMASPKILFASSFMVKTESGEYGYGQFAINDIDTDGDGLVDSYEEAFGLSKYYDNANKKDTDGDSLTDVFEAFYGTHPTKKDTDGDNYSDGFEYHMKSYPLDPNCNPIDGCTNIAPTTEPEQPHDPQTGTETPTSQDDPPVATNTNSSGGGAMLWLLCALFLLFLVRQSYIRKKR